MWGLHPTAAPPMAAGKPRLWLVSGTLGAHWGNGDTLGEWGHIEGNLQIVFFSFFFSSFGE